jgi:beta-lactamase class C
MSIRTLHGIFSAIAIASLWFPAHALPAEPPAADVAARFQPFFASHVQDESITGAAFVIASREGIIALGTAGHTDTTRSRPIDQDTVFRVASVSKTFAAGLTGMLVRDGQFGWDDRVIDHVPDFRIKGDSSRVRVRHLLGQSTGLIPHAYDNLIEDGLPLDRIQEKYRELDYICQPGACYSYQNSIFSLIEPVIERTTSTSYGQLMETKIFRPLEMKTASVGYEAFVGNPNHALPHVRSGGRWKTVSVQPNYYRVAPAAGVNASAQDMGKWLVAQLGGNPDVIDPAVIQALVEPRVETVRDKRRKFWRDLLSEAHYGLGWRIYRLGDHQIAYHSGWVSGYRADIAWSAEHDIGIAVLMNVESSSISELTTTFWRMAFEQLSTRGSDDDARVAATSNSGRQVRASSAR